MFKPNREEIAWAAGFFDGEGCTTNVTSGRARRPYVSMKVSQSGEYAPALLERVNAALGNLGYVVGPYSPSGLGKLMAYEVKWTSIENCQAVLAMLWPFLGPAKKAQALRVFTRYLAHAVRPYRVLRD